ncbi:MAG: Hpt domain-containing protein [Planctomycetaceae bacterium]|nr:Hpt domain-containing protein [Planctomycetales bacterium]MCA9145093.1 Hpt domain-containing protein [Planctomycetales bacterium]MCB9875780.1 Hpt domain-containing protein [Planctomycetaceae bacterium]HRX82523.1 Hpt domain-containing protein [Pirellulaceae bacterium]
MSELTVRSGYVYSTLGLDPDLGDLVEMFVDELPNRVSKLQECWDRTDLEGLGRAAHQLKGAAGSYGFEELTPSLTRLDYSVRMSRSDDEILSAIEEVIELCSRARAGAPE